MFNCRLALRPLLPSHRTFLSVVFALAVGASVQAAERPRPKTPDLDRFHVFSLSNLVASESDFQGVTGALGTITLTNFSIAEKQPSRPHLLEGRAAGNTVMPVVANNAVLEAGSNLSLQSLEVFGNVRAGGKIRTKEVNIHGETRAHRPNRSLRLATRDAIVLSRYWSGHSGDLSVPEFKQTTNDRRSTGAPIHELVFRARSGKATYYNVDATALSQTDVITLMGPIGTEVAGEMVINVRGFGEFNILTLGLASTLKARVRVLGNVSAANVTFHFPNARRLNIILPPTNGQPGSTTSGWQRGFFGSIVAPRARVRAGFGCLQGRLIVGNYIGTLQVNLPEVACDPWE